MRETSRVCTSSKDGVHHGDCRQDRPAHRLRLDGGSQLVHDPDAMLAAHASRHDRSRAPSRVAKAASQEARAVPVILPGGCLPRVHRHWAAGAGAASAGPRGLV